MNTEELSARPSPLAWSVDHMPPAVDRAPAVDARFAAVAASRPRFPTAGHWHGRPYSPPRVSSFDARDCCGTGLQKRARGAEQLLFGVAQLSPDTAEVVYGRTEACNRTYDVAIQRTMMLRRYRFLIEPKVELIDFRRKKVSRQCRHTQPLRLISERICDTIVKVSACRRHARFYCSCAASLLCEP